MKVNKILGALALSLAAFGANAATVGTYNLGSGAVQFQFGGAATTDAVDTFVFNATPGVYNVVVSLAGIFTDIDWANTTLNGNKGSVIASGSGFDFGTVAVTNSTPPFTLNIAHTTSSSLANYAGSITAVAAAVPEPESYAMFMAGLGIMGAVARRRRQRG